MYAKLTKITTLAVPNSSTSSWGGSFLPNDFHEFQELIKQFERCKFYKVVIRVIPQQNISNNSTSRVPQYCILPWHRPVEAPKSFNDVISVDRAKIRRQTQGVKMSFVPNCMYEAGGTEYPPNVTKAFVSYIWKPEIYRIQTPTNQPVYPRIYCGFIAFQGEATLTSTSYFDIITDVYCIFKNQSVISQTG